MDKVGSGDILPLVFSSTQSLKTASIQDDFFFQEKAFSFEDYLSFSTSEVKTIIVDPTAFITPSGRIPFNPIGLSATDGPILVDFYSGSASNNDGTILQGSNRISTATKLFPDTVLRLNPTGISLGTRFAGDLVPSSSSGPGGFILGSGANTQSLPFVISSLSKYAIRLTNLGGDNTYVEIKLTWFEV